MDYIEGTDVRTLPERSTSSGNLLMPVPLAAFIVSRIARSLAYGATKTIIHRDISPEKPAAESPGRRQVVGLRRRRRPQRTRDDRQGCPTCLRRQIGGEVVDPAKRISTPWAWCFTCCSRGFPLQKVPMRMSAEDRVEYARKLLERSAAVAQQGPGPDVPGSDLRDLHEDAGARPRQALRAGRVGGAGSGAEVSLCERIRSHEQLAPGPTWRSSTAGFKENPGPSSCKQLPFSSTGELKRAGIQRLLHARGKKAFLDEVPQPLTTPLTLDTPLSADNLIPRLKEDGPCAFLVSILLFGMLSIVAADDEVKLKNGDRLSGKVVGLAGGKLNMVTPETGPVEPGLDADRVDQERTRRSS